jgi:diketogulonate reductase-like aldo/keto reductase
MSFSFFVVVVRASATIRALRWLAQPKEITWQCATIICLVAEARRGARRPAAALAASRHFKGAPAYGWFRSRFKPRNLPRVVHRRNRKVKINDPRTLNRRELTGYFLTFSLAVPTLVTMAAAPSAAAAPASGIVANGVKGTVKFHDGTVVPALGQGSARLGQGRHPGTVEEEALREGIALGMTLIDTAEIYGNGDAEKLIAHVIAGRREHVFLVSKVWPTHVAGDGVERACEGSLARLGTDYLDLYLLHWPNGVTDLSGVVAAFENLRAKGKIRAWGVSNFNVIDMERLLNVPHGDSCATNQVPYSLSDRAIEHDLLPWCAQHAIPLMAYSPLGGASSTLLRDPTLARIGAAHGCSAAAVALAWTIRSGKVIAIPESGNVAHVRENAVALSLALTSEDLQALDAAHPPPSP